MLTLMKEPQMLTEQTLDALLRARRIHIIGVCGTAMGTLSGLMKSRGLEVRGSDRAFYPPMSDLLNRWGIETYSGYKGENLDWGPDFVVVGNVVRRDNPEAIRMRELGIPHGSFPSAFAALYLAPKRPVVVTGTHGKTTTTSLTAWLLESSGLSPGLLVGGLPRNFNSSFRVGDGPHFVVEGDEYDTAYFDKVPKFLHYMPQVGVITNIEFDHADIYTDIEHIEGEFKRFASLVPKNGRLLVWAGSNRALAVSQHAKCEVETYGIGDGDWCATNLTSTQKATSFDLSHRNDTLGRITIPLFGEHNVQNTVAAAAVALGEGVSFQNVVDGAAAFKNVAKRHEIKGIERGVTVIDDFAHHPTAVAATVAAVRKRFPTSRLFCCFEVESNTSRRRVFQDAYAPAFDGSHAVLFCKPHEKDDGLPESEQLQISELIESINARGPKALLIPEVEEIVSWLLGELRDGDVVLGMSGRHFHGLHDRLVAALADG
jgi:UDP-N-acetylmuramate: L-alanyl-gamma-D-glutamyl-meso-diaminopimelate ligase